MTPDKEARLPSIPLRGSNQTTVRGANERLVLHLVRQHGTMTKADATRATGLSPNALSVIFRSLEEDGFLLRCEPIRGRIGQPSTPMRLNPDARFHIGLKIGRSSFDMIVADFVGGVRARRTSRHGYPTPDATADFLRREVPGLLADAGLPAGSIAGSHVAMPSELWHWTEDFGAPAAEMTAWQTFAVEDLSALLPGPVTAENDGTAACRAELVFGPGVRHLDTIYFFVGTFIGGGIVLNGSVFSGRRGNSGGLGPLRVPDEAGGNRLVDHASLAVLKRMLRDAGHDHVEIPDETDDWDRLEPVLGQWVIRAARSLAHAIVSSLAVIDFEGVIIDGALPPAIRTRLLDEVQAHIRKIDLQGVALPDIEEGHLGQIARALGAAARPISASYMVDGNAVLQGG
ncbi:ROK family transcriptional regulator [Anianabacter salinae]|uniref:ROK family transcriptional regulator n=1 Tax=Anianabacter salinae TaxID=2851023 RepID=UPI00225DDA17|nr:ROK family transcriptional regulator [Anianabacter salinae]MBV0914084.1 ROK family transcriptional regulator [Anianabacter salinae]